MPAEPMLASPLARPVVPLSWVAEPKWDGFRVLVARRSDGRVLVRSRHGTDLAPAFPEIAAAAAEQLRPGVLLDGELVIWEGGRLAFERLGQRMGRRGQSAARLAEQIPAHVVVFDVLYVDDVSTQTRPYAERRSVLEGLFVPDGLRPPWTLCPAASVTDLSTLRTWMSWSVVGVEGLVLKDPLQRYRPGVRGWRKYRVRDTTEAVVGAVTGSLARPGSVLLGRLDDRGRLRFVGRTVPLPATAARDLTPLLHPARSDHLWRGREFSAGWGTRETLEVALVDPDLVAEVSADVSLDAAGRWRHPVRFLRARPDMAPADVPPFGAGNEPASG
ncbi:ATP-dependent DNA ligase [Streptomyces niveus]|uniref:ATP-dependent DNA ligase n=1 Tax=Streptomyces niveus TaxID=193462 RepID=UPI0036586093